MSSQNSPQNRDNRRSDSITNMIGATENVLVAAATAASCGYVYGEIAAVGNTFLAIIVTAVLAVVMFMVLRALYQWGLHTLPYLNEEERRRSVPPFILALGFAVIISITTAALWLAGPAAQRAHIQSSIERSLSATDEVTSAARTGLAAGQRVKPKKTELVSARENELSAGGFCSSGRGGTGPCATILMAQVVAADQVEKALDNISSDSEVLFTRIETEQDALRRILEDEGLTYTERVSQVNDSLSRLAIHVSQLQALIPVEALSGLAQTYGQDWSNQGLSAIGAQRLRSMLRPLSQDLRYAVSEMEDARRIKVEGILPKNAFQLIAENFSAVFAIAMMGALPDVIGCALLLLSYYSVRSSLRGASRGDSPPPDHPSGPAPQHATSDILSDLVRAEVERRQKSLNGSAPVPPAHN